MNNIKCNKSINATKTLRSCKSQIEEYCKQLEETLNNVSEAWQGADATKYIDKMRDDYLFSFTGLLDGLEECIKYLEDHVPNDYNDHDNKYQGREISV